VFFLHYGRGFLRLPVQLQAQFARAAIDAAEAAYEVATTHPIVYRAPQGEPLLARLDRFFGN